MIPTAHPEFHLPQYRPFEERNEVKTKGHLSEVFFVAFDYIRFRVVDKKGKKAYTNAYYFDEFAD